MKNATEDVPSSSQSETSYVINADRGRLEIAFFLLITAVIPFNPMRSLFRFDFSRSSFLAYRLSASAFSRYVEWTCVDIFKSTSFLEYADRFSSVCAGSAMSDKSADFFRYIESAYSLSINLTTSDFGRSSLDK